MNALPDVQSNLTTGIPLRTVPEKGAPPKERLSNPRDARTLVSTLVEGNKWRAEFWRLAKGQLDGNPPYDDAELSRLGQQWRANLNPMDTKARVSAAMTPYYDLFASGKYYCEVELDDEVPERRKRNSVVVTTEFYDLLKQWRAFKRNVYCALFDRLYFGNGYVIWPDESDMEFDYVPQHRVLVPDGTECDPEKADTIVVRQRLTVARLWSMIRERKVAEDRGWNTAAVARSIRHANPDTVNISGINGDNYMEVQQWLKDRDSVESARCPRVLLAHIYQPEFDGTISHYMIVEDSVPGEPEEGEWLFRKTSQYENIHQAVCPFFYEVLDDSWHGSNGMSRDIYQVMEINNRMVSELINGAFLRSGISLQAMNERARQNTALVQVGAFNIIPPGYQVHQSSIMGDLEGSMATARFLDERIDSNTSTFRPRVEKPKGNPETATGEKLRYQSASILTNSAVDRLWEDLDGMYSETYRRACDPQTTNPRAKEFQRRCAEQGVTGAQLRKVHSVTAFRILGNGSLFMGQQAITGMFPFIGLFKPAGRENFLDDAIGVLASDRMVERWNPKSDPAPSVERDQWDAITENANIKIGAPVKWTSVQNNIVHIQQHLQAASEAAASLQEGANPVSVLAYLQGQEHHLGEHFQHLSRDKQHAQEFKALNGQFSELQKTTKALERSVEEMQREQSKNEEAKKKAAAIEAGTDPNVRIKAATEKQKMGLRASKAASDRQLKVARVQQEMAIRDAQAAQTMRNQSAQTGAK